MKEARHFAGKVMPDLESLYGTPQLESELIHASEGWFRQHPWPSPLLFGTTFGTEILGTLVAVYGLFITPSAGSTHSGSRAMRWCGSSSTTWSRYGPIGCRAGRGLCEEPTRAWRSSASARVGRESGSHPADTAATRLPAGSNLPRRNQGYANLSALTSDRDRGIYDALRDATYVAQARIELSAVTRPNGADLDPA